MENFRTPTHTHSVRWHLWFEHRLQIKMSMYERSTYHMVTWRSSQCSVVTYDLKTEWWWWWWWFTFWQCSSFYLSFAQTLLAFFRWPFMYVHTELHAIPTATLEGEKTKIENLDWQRQTDRERDRGGAKFEMTIFEFWWEMRFLWNTQNWFSKFLIRTI